jgi:hypothetical protein
MCRYFFRFRSTNAADGKSAASGTQARKSFSVACRRNSRNECGSGRVRLQVGAIQEGFRKTDRSSMAATSRRPTNRRCVEARTNDRYRRGRYIRCRERQPGGANNTCGQAVLLDLDVGGRNIGVAVRRQVDGLGLGPPGFGLGALEPGARSLKPTRCSTGSGGPVEAGTCHHSQNIPLQGRRWAGSGVGVLAFGAVESSGR